ncbi:hypothetical protein [Leisingera sp. M658]|uniref:hypothetical protein n=1 Tax=Leisingera sp. M658 TaxID=2867015 RepID=UPI0021A8FDE2|nr:hypothetical protein [Leisingera sp. M658]UWQ77381.1 hypothetical protein K3724_22615 [Leisingera sp. M658]
MAQSLGALDIGAERRRHIEGEGFTAERDDAYTEFELERAAACYALMACKTAEPWMKPQIDYAIRNLWPWHSDWQKDALPRHLLTKAGALVAAAMDKYDRSNTARAEQLQRLAEIEQAASDGFNAWLRKAQSRTTVALHTLQP